MDALINRVQTSWTAGWIAFCSDASFRSRCQLIHWTIRKRLRVVEGIHCNFTVSILFEVFRDPSFQFLNVHRGNL